MNLFSLVDHGAFMWASRALLAAAIGLLAWAGATLHWADAIALAAISLVIGAILFEGAKLPSLFGFLLGVAAAVNGAGYALQLWHDETLFDEVVHAFTTFAGMLAIGWALRGNALLAGSRFRLFSSVIAIGLALGVLWEIFEWAIGIIGRPHDTAIDLVMDSIGAVAAAVLLSRLVGRAPSTRLP